MADELLNAKLQVDLSDASTAIDAVEAMQQRIERKILVSKDRLGMLQNESRSMDRAITMIESRAKRILKHGLRSMGALAIGGIVSSLDMEMTGIASVVAHTATSALTAFTFSGGDPFSTALAGVYTAINSTIQEIKRVDGKLEGIKEKLKYESSARIQFENDVRREAAIAREKKKEDAENYELDSREKRLEEFDLLEETYGTR